MSTAELTGDKQQELSIVSQQSVITAPTMERPEHPLADLRHAAMSLPLEQIRGLLDDYMARRTEFRAWLMAQLKLGVHYGVPPGCEPRGNVRPEQWVNKPSLYKAGAEFICDLMNVRPKYTADLDGSQQMGELKPDKSGEVKRYFVYKCELFSRQTGELLGEGTGARQLGAKGGDVNNSVKMAQKNALTAAVLNVYGLSDLFTQDYEPPEFQNPEQKADAPRAAPRGERVTKKTLDQFFGRFRAYLNPEAQAHDFSIWLADVTARRGIDFTQPSNWTPEMVSIVDETLRKSEPQ